MSALKKAARLKKEAFAALDASKKGTTVRVNYNDLIDVCLAFEEASNGDYANLDFSNEINFRRYMGLSKILDRIADIVPVDSKVWQLCFSEYKPEFNVDPDQVLAELALRE